MIQRTQSILLLLVALLGIAFSFLPILRYELAGETYFMKAYNTMAEVDGNTIVKNMGVGFIGGVIIVLSLIIIFLFKKRQLQIKLAKLNILLIALQIAAVVFYSDAIKLAIGEGVAVSFKLGAIFPVLSLVLTYLSIHFIKKDENLVRAADRLR